MKHFIAAIAASILATPAMAWNCDEERTINKEFDIGTLRDIQVQAGAGELSVKGSDQQGKISIVAKLCASDQDLLAKMDVKTGIDDDAASVETVLPKKWSGNYSAAIDLELVVPNNAQLKVKDSSGDLAIKDVSSLVLVDSSGDINLKNIDGEVELTDSSGEIKMRKIGSAKLTDSSGGIDVQDIANNFTVVVDSSGEIEVEGVGGDVLIKVDSSGSIDVKDVAGNFTVEKDGSGSISYDDVEGEVTIPSRKR